MPRCPSAVLWPLFTYLRSSACRLAQCWSAGVCRDSVTKSANRFTCDQKHAGGHNGLSATVSSQDPILAYAITCLSQYTALGVRCQPFMASFCIGILKNNTHQGVSDKTPLRQNPLYKVKFWMTFNSSERDLSEYICTVCLHRKMS